MQITDRGSTILCSLAYACKLASAGVIQTLIKLQWSIRCLILGGPNFFGDIYMYTYVCTHLVFFTCVKAQQKFLKLQFVLA